MHEKQGKGRKSRAVESVTGVTAKSEAAYGEEGAEEETIVFEFLMWSE